MAPNSTFQTLKSRQREIRHTFPESLGLRVHRAISWYGRAEQEKDDLDAQFIFLWIAFNAAYSNELGENHRIPEKGLFRNFIKKLIDLDEEKKLYQLLWKEFSGSIRLFIENKFVFQPFWEFHNGNPNYSDWEEQFLKSQEHARKAIGKMDTESIIMVILDRLYTMRNQLVHGGATWNSSANRTQLRDAVAIMNKLLPTIINTMMDHPNELWGDPIYPVIKE